jgi:hypothetical protein
MIDSEIDELLSFSIKLTLEPPPTPIPTTVSNPSIFGLSPSESLRGRGLLFEGFLVRPEGLGLVSSFSCGI